MRIVMLGLRNRMAPKAVLQYPRIDPGTGMVQNRAFLHIKISVLHQEFA